LEYAEQHNIAVNTLIYQHFPSFTADDFNEYKLPVSVGRKVLQKQFSNPDKDSRGAWMAVSLLSTSLKANPDFNFDIINPLTKQVYQRNGKTWKYSKEHIEILDADNRIIWSTRKNAHVSYKMYQFEIPAPEMFRKIITLHPDTRNGMVEMAASIGVNKQDIMRAYIPFLYDKLCTVVSKSKRKYTRKSKAA
jgi:hypothetical protein